MKTGKKQKDGIIYLLLILGAFVMVFPFIWSFLTSFKNLGETLKVPPQILPSLWDPVNYITVWNKLPFLHFIWNTLLMMLIRMVVAVFISAMAAYAFARMSFPLKNFWFMVCLIPMMVPSQIYILPQYLTVSSLHLNNTILGLAIPGLASTFGIFLLRQFFMTIPNDLEEAAVLDGCNPCQIFFRIMLPLVKSGLVSLAIFTALFAYKDLLWPLIVNTSTNKMPLSSGLALMQGQYTTNYPELMAGAMIAIIPILIIFLAFQKQFVEGIATTGIKG